MCAPISTGMVHDFQAAKQVGAGWASRNHEQFALFAFSVAWNVVDVSTCVEIFIEGAVSCLCTNTVRVACRFSLFARMLNVEYSNNSYTHSMHTNVLPELECFARSHSMPTVEMDSCTS